MIEKQKLLFCWSGGKDSALALYHLKQDPTVEVLALLTTFNATYDRVSMHGVRREMVREQARQIGLPLIEMEVGEATNAAYEKAMEETLLSWKKKGVEAIGFGDIFLEDLRSYREANLKKMGMHAVFPLWKKNTTALLKEFIGLKFNSVLCCINNDRLEQRWLGRTIDAEFLDEIPSDVDPAGENGEYHSFCFQGPIFSDPIGYQKGEEVYREFRAEADKKSWGFWYLDLLPVMA